MGVRVTGGHERNQPRRLQVVLDRPIRHTSALGWAVDVVFNQTQVPGTEYVRLLLRSITHHVSGRCASRARSGAVRAVPSTFVGSSVLVVDTAISALPCRCIRATVGSHAQCSLLVCSILMPRKTGWATWSLGKVKA